MKDETVRRSISEMMKRPAIRHLPSECERSTEEIVEELSKDYDSLLDLYKSVIRRCEWISDGYKELYFENVKLVNRYKKIVDVLLAINPEIDLSKIEEKVDEAELTVEEDFEITEM